MDRTTRVPHIHAAERRVVGSFYINSWSSASAHSSRQCSAPSTLENRGNLGALPGFAPGKPRQKS